MKRIIILLLAVSILLFSCACGNEKTNDVSDTLYNDEYTTEDEYITSLTTEGDDGDFTEDITTTRDSDDDDAIDRDENDGRTDVTTKEPSEATIKSTTVKATSSPAQDTSNVVTVIIKPGQSLTQIFQTLEDNGVSDFDALLETSQTYDYSYYPLVAAQKSNSHRCFRLEGYLFPDTYEFYKNMKPQDAIGKFLRNAEAKITDDMRSSISRSGYSIDEILTIASMIQEEGSKSTEMTKVSSVIYNRIDIDMQLKMDSTINYIEKYVKPYIDGDINRYNSYYNTYKCDALPAGAICSPSLAAIKAAISPADTGYYFFCNDSNGNYYYAENGTQHEENVKKAGIS